MARDAREVLCWCAWERGSTALAEARRKGLVPKVAMAPARTHQLDVGTTESAAKRGLLARDPDIGDVPRL